MKLAENPNDLQASLNKIEKYCDTFDWHINVTKTKILFFSREKLRKHHIFNFGVHILDTVDGYKYLSSVFNYNSNLEIAKSHLYQKRCRTMFSLLLSLPLDIMLKLVNVIVKPVVLYGAEVWGGENCDILERPNFFKCDCIVCKYVHFFYDGLQRVGCCSLRC